jgi:hypothetical protein
MNIYTSILILILVLHKGLATYTAYSGKYWKKLLHSTYYNKWVILQQHITHIYDVKLSFTDPSIPWKGQDDTLWSIGCLFLFPRIHSGGIKNKEMLQQQVDWDDSKVWNWHLQRYSEAVTLNNSNSPPLDVDCDDYCHQQKQTYKRLYYSCNVGFILTGKPTTKPTILHQHGCTTDTLICEGKRAISMEFKITSSNSCSLRFSCPSREWCHPLY